jgi:GSH-dependent disulfide-bond oxidoreductase
MLTIWAANTANGVKPVILAEEMGLPYALHGVDFRAGQHRSPELTAINPLGRVPMLHDPDGPGGASLDLGESGAMASYLARKTGLLGGRDPREAATVDYWLHAANATLAPVMGRQFWLKFMAPEKVESLIAAGAGEAMRFLAVFEARLASGTPYLAGEDFTIADAMAWPHTHFSPPLLGLDISGLPALCAWRDKVLARPGVARAVAGVAALG